MRRSRFFWIALLVTLCARDSQAQTVEEYRQRRQKVQEALGEKGMMILRSSQSVDTFKLDKDFYYLTGLSEPEAILALTSRDETLVLPPRNPQREIWEAKRLFPGPETEQKTGVAHSMATDEFTKQLDTLLKGKTSLWFSYRAAPDAPLPSVVEKFVKLNYGSETTVRNPESVIAPLRLIKSSSETAHLTRAADITVKSIKNAMESVKPGKTENEIMAMVDFAFRLHGATGRGFDIIAGSGPNSVILHATPTDRKTQSGDLLVLDIGAEFNQYSADVTRTIPVSGKFTERQKQIYTIVLKAQDESIRAIKKGATLADIHRKATEVIQDELLKIGLIQKKAEYTKYFMHGTSHWIGLEVHDVGAYTTPLAPGMAFTIEPGIYIPEESLGVRIEDDFLMTGDGFLHLSKDAPRSIEDIEKLMAGPGR